MTVGNISGTISTKVELRHIKLFSCLTEYEISIAHKIIIPKSKEVFALSNSDVVFIMLINVKMPTSVCILTFMSKINFVPS